MKMKIGKFRSRRKFKSQRGLFHKDDGDLSQKTIIIAGLVVAAIFVTGGVAVAAQKGAKSTAICINNSTSFSQNGNLGEDCRRETEEINDSSEEAVEEIFGSTTPPGSSEEEEEVLECTYDDSTEAEDRQAIEEVYRELLELLLRLSREETLDINSFLAEIEQVMGDNGDYQEILDGTFDQEKIDKALEVSRKYIGELPPVFIPEDSRGNKQIETLYKISTSFEIYTYASHIKSDFPFMETENVEFVINRDNFLYYGDSAMYSVWDTTRDKSKDVLKIYVNGEEIEDYYTDSGHSLHYADGIALIGEHFIKEDCSWKYVVSPVRQGDIFPSPQGGIA